MRCFAGAGLLAVLASAALAAEPTRVEVTRDNSIVLVDGEWQINGGGLSQIRIKGNQHLVAMDFDRAPLAGRRIASATLVCQKGDASIAGLTVSTIQAPWDEFKSNSLVSGAGDVEGWGYPGARFPAVTGGNAFSLVCQSPSALEDGAYRWAVHPDLVHALAVGAAYGLALHEFDADYSRNPTIYSREQSAKKPHLVVTFGGDEPDPEPPADLKVVDTGLPDGLRLTLRAPRQGFAYEVSVNGSPLPRWNTPFVRPGEAQTIPLRGVPLQAGSEVTVSVATLNRLGKRTPPVSVRGKVPASWAVAFPKAPEPASAGAPPEGLAVIPLQDKYDAAGKPVGALPEDYRSRNAVFDGRTITLTAARGEVVGFQALVTGEGKVTATCNLPGLRTDLWRAVYVPAEKGRRIPDPLVPLGELTLSKGEATPVCVDVFVPFEFAGREVEGTLALSDGRKLPIRLKVRGFAIPREVSFACEMNGYGLPDKVGEFYRIQEVAYDHRVHANLLAYGHRSTDPSSHTSSMQMEMADGRRMDERRYNDIKPGAARGWWDDFATAFGPYLSGSHFKDGHRGPVPAPGFYLTFHESWPLRVREFFSGNPDAYEAFKARPEYAETFVSVLKDFIETARRQGWTRTGFQVYLNNKGSLADKPKAPWILDEPVSYWDYRALAYYGDLVRRAKGGNPGVRLDYRIDISRPEFDRGQLLGKCDLWVVSSSALRAYPRLVADRAERTGERIWVYGTSNGVEETNRTIEAWVLEAYRSGATGVLPWQTISEDGSAMTKADPLGLFILAKGPDGRRVCHHSMRLKAYRSAQQTVEYLELLRAKRGLTPAQVRALVDHYLDLAGTVRQAYAEDAGTPQYVKVTPESLRQLREAAATMLEEPRR